MQSVIYLVRLTTMKIRLLAPFYIAQITLIPVFAQAPQDVRDTTKLLTEVVVHGYLYDRPLNEVPASIAVLRPEDFERYSNTSILPAMNSIPGVRMEERSPGSNRFSIRGSLLRSPFGVRNVKVYWNGLPLTDGGGNTYINILDFNALTSSEIIKGPGGSLYGAGTGGVVLLNKVTGTKPSLSLSSVFGSYGLQRYQMQGEVGNETVKASFQYTHQQANGYRTQTEMRRDALNGDVSLRLNSKSSLTATLFYTDLFYETPGGLTKAQYEQDPRQARPAKTSPPPLPGAVEARAAVRNKTGYIGLMHDYEWNEHWSARTGVYGSITSFENPTVRNYESRDEDNIGARHEAQYKFGAGQIKGKVTVGGEYQYFFSPLRVFSNVDGKPGSLESDDELKSRQLLAFGQIELDLPQDIFVTAGLSSNFLRYNFLAKLASPAMNQRRKFDPVLSPRIAALKKLGRLASVYGSVSRGFSPPSLAEVRPSAGTYNNSLDPERGMSYELGVKGNILNQLTYDITTYSFQLDKTIVIQRNDDGAEYFINAGRTSQRGLEAKISWMPVIETAAGASLKIWGSYTYSHYRFRDYVNDAVDYSGKRITGVAPTVAVVGLDFSLWKFYVNITGNYTDATPLNDANSEYASEYYLLGSRLGFKSTMGNSGTLEVFTGIDNATNQTYSLGNDLNAIGGRYYNAAAGRNYFAGVSFKPVFAPKRK